MDTEPLIHSFITDCLPEDHPWAHKTVMCGYCGEMVHAFNNECMQPWIEWRSLALCFSCFVPAFRVGLSYKDFRITAPKFPCTNGD